MWIDRFSNVETAVSYGRLWWGYLVAAGVLSLLVAALALRRSGRGLRLPALVRHAFALHFWRKTTVWIDLKVILANKVLLVPLLAATAGGVTASAIAVATLLGGSYDWAKPGEYGALACIATTFLIVAARDFADYVAHVLNHKVPALWAFHRLHHSAERLTPLTTSRKHPVEYMVQIFAGILIAGPILGVASAAFGGLDVWLLLGGNAIYLVYNLLVANLRHSHVWIHWPAPFSLIFSTPAQHQIHHSRLPQHWDMNYARIFSLWDWMFGTLYNPTKRERIVFGLSAEFGVERPRPHQTLAAALFEPFTYMNRKRAEQAAQPALLPPAQPAQPDPHTPPGWGTSPATPTAAAAQAAA